MMAIVTGLAVSGTGNGQSVTPPGLRPSAGSSPAENQVSPGEPPFSWSNGRLSVRYPGEAARLELRPAQGEDRLSLCVFPTHLETDGESLPVPAQADHAERLTGSNGEIWRFTSTVHDAARGLDCFYTSEFDLPADRGWVRRRCRIRLEGKACGPILLRRIVLDETDVSGLQASQPFDGWQSYPILSRSFFWGVEFPAAAARVSGHLAQLVSRPGVRIVPGITYDTWPVMYGVAAAGAARDAFEAYVAALRPPSEPVHIQYNSWWSLPFPYTHAMMLDLIESIGEQFHRLGNGKLDSFCLDLGWSDRRSIWQIDRRNFPEGFAPLSWALGKMGARLGLWVSPSAVYPEALDLEWARADGYETHLLKPDHRVACLAGPRYSDALRRALVDVETRYGIAHFKFDGYVPTCPESDHGHEPGELSAEQTALAIIHVFQALRTADPKVWIEATCFGYRPSPWWLAHVNSVIGTYGDDAPAGRTPCPIYRESYTTARDFFNLQGTRDVLIPAKAQEVLGVIHQTPEPLQNDAVVTAMRGHAFLPLYVNPGHMDARRWRFLARWSQWVRANADLLTHTRPICTGMWADPKASREWGSPVGRDVYGYAHFRGHRGLVMLRNPWLHPRPVSLRLDEQIGCPRELAGATATQVYPLYATMSGEWRHGLIFSVTLRPYETRVIAFGPPSGAPVEPAGDEPWAAVERPPDDPPLPVEPGGVLTADLRIRAGDESRELWILAEGEAPLAAPEAAVRVNGEPVELRLLESADGWRASLLPDPLAWAWLVAPLPAGKATVTLRVEAAGPTTVSAWVMTREELAENANDPGPLPPPEFRYLGASMALPQRRLDVDRPADEINLARSATGARSVASSVFSPEYTPERAIDDDPVSRWNSGTGDINGAWLQIDLPAPCELRELRFHEAAGGRITHYRLQAWDGHGWIDVLDRRKPPPRTQVRHRFPPVRTSRVRLLVVEATQLPTIYALELHGRPLPSATASAPAR